MPVAGAAEELTTSIARCAALEGTLDRLECYDRLARKLRLDRPQRVPTEVGDVGDWRVTRDVNPIDDSERVVIGLTASSGRSQWGRPISFVARCKSDKTEAYIIWNDYVGDDSSSVYEEWKWVTIRIGDRPARVQRWGVSTDKEATFAPAWAGNLLKEMVGETQLIAQITPFAESPVTAIFDITGIENALKPLSEACNWSLDG